jgi:hypothetical protein
MKWLIQNSGVTFACLDNNVAPLVEAIDKRGSTRHAIGVIPFTDNIVGMDDIDVSGPTMFYGSTRLVEIAGHLPIKPGVFFTHSWFDPQNWVGKRPDLLNESQSYITVGELRKNWITEPVFIKSVDPKVLTGMVLESDNPPISTTISEKEWWLIEYEHLKDEDRLVISPVQSIEREWRFFIVNGEIVTGSQYKHDGLLRIREPIAENVWKQVRRMAQEWLPSPNIVMDVALMADGSFKVVEFNCLNSSGFYASPIEPLLEAFERLV